MSAFYSEFDPFAAAWLRELMKAGCISEGTVDERSIEDVAPDDLAGFGRVHLFAGIGVWDYALALAGFPAGREVWTCSCPCQPFSSAGKGGGFDDERHLWPAAFHLVAQRRPELCFGEQVASADGLTWLDLVCADLEGVGYSVGSIVTPAAGFGAPHRRHRIWWVAVPDEGGRGEAIGNLRGRQPDTPRGGVVGDLAHPAGNGTRRAAATIAGGNGAEVGVPGANGQARRVADSAGDRAEGEQREEGRSGRTRGAEPSGGCADGAAGVVLDDTGSEGLQGRQREGAGEGAERAGRLPPAGGGAVGGFWADAEWLPCSDGKYRPVEPGTFPLAHGAAARVGRLRGYGNAIVATQAAGFIRAFLEAEGSLNGGEL